MKTIPPSPSFFFSTLFFPIKITNHFLTSGFSACSLSANFLSGWLWIERAVCTDSTLNKNGSVTGPKCSAEAPPTAAGACSSRNDWRDLFEPPPDDSSSSMISEGPEGCVPIQSSA